MKRFSWLYPIHPQHRRHVLARYITPIRNVEWMMDGNRLLLQTLGWSNYAHYFWVLDLQTGEGAYFRHGGCAVADLNKHAIWVCPLYEPFLVWLYGQKPDLATLPESVELPQAESALYGYRRKGPAP